MCLYISVDIYVKHNFEINLTCVHVAVVSLISLIHRNMNYENPLLIENKGKAIYDALIMVFKQ